ncbi:MAG: hypothetical protein IPK70_11255 [Flavobacteriales bacterium]|jgi:hypothetical protein|nr:hypothetical protein [Flavobacteriales bacterium]
MRYQQCMVLAACAAVLASGCRKDKDSSPPTVRITSPGAGFSVGIPDTLTVGLSVSDDIGVQSVSVLLADVDGVPVTPSVTVTIGALSREFSIDLPLLSERIESGPCIITAIASDGTNDARDFVSITVQAAPLRVRSMFLVPLATGPPPCIITRIDSIGGASVFAGLSEFSGAAVGLDHLFTAGTAAAPLERRRISTGAMSPIMPNPGLWPQYFTCLSRDMQADRIFACGADGVVRGFTLDGAAAFTAALPVGCAGDAVATIGDAVVCAAFDQVAQQSSLVRMGGSSGAVLAQFSSDARAVALFAVDAQRFLLFGNTAAGGVIQEVSATLGGAFTMRVFPGDEMRCAARVDGGLYAVGLASGIHRFDYPSAAATPILPGLPAHGLTFDPVSGAVLAATGNTAIAFDPLLGTIVSTLPAPHPISQVLLQLNR